MTKIAGPSQTGHAQVRWGRTRGARGMGRHEARSAQEAASNARLVAGSAPIGPKAGPSRFDPAVGVGFDPVEEQQARDRGELDQRTRQADRRVEHQDPGDHDHPRRPDRQLEAEQDHRPEPEQAGPAGGLDRVAGLVRRDPERFGRSRVVDSGGQPKLESPGVVEVRQRPGRREDRDPAHPRRFEDRPGERRPVDLGFGPIRVSPPLIPPGPDRQRQAGEQRQQRRTDHEGEEQEIGERLIPVEVHGPGRLRR